MVDLVKIRKKAREQKEREEAARQQSDETSASDAQEPRASSAAERLEAFKSRLAADAPQEQQDDFSESDVSSTSDLEVLTFAIGNEEYAIPIDSVVEIMTPSEITRVPNAPRNISGIISLRGTIVTILDVASKLGHEAVSADLDTRIVVVRDAVGSAGFIVDKVLRVVKLPAEELDSEPVATPASRNDLIKGVFRRNDNLSILLDIDRLVGDDASDEPDDV